ncbi:uncharacterized protein TRIADDRAFT_51402 [Trichoplax adhaerens]|uniref:Profilin n=1 Tax=Trichoplax adhaerens TaxID=10228 RepID=B3RIX2_TRIAD|nr:hypothetical protein TRIADDRAFT_51402 [Trichoplax adhaerens]EDV28466.1 hypothetical protein TRIADDRAFT_51402 [Trichoplax adhaerens]|eukprot:XP_002107668.1 hypothetical protein TRIADDRAFT_51402 [Trichoplax adhaerens]
MSWDGFITKIVASGKVAQAAIYGRDGCIWALSPGFQLSGDEVKVILDYKKNISSLKTDGFTVNGVKYTLLTVAQDQCMLIGTAQQGGGVYISFTKQAFVLGTYTHSMQPGPCETVISETAEELIKLGY